MLPLHILCSHCHDIDAVIAVTEAYPEAVAVVDRQGRTCLHLAVLAVGKDHESFVAKEEEEEETLLKENQKSTAQPTEDQDVQIDDLEQESTSVTKADAVYERKGSQSRDIVRYLISKHPRALITFNNFQALPVDTVLETTRRGNGGVSGKSHKNTSSKYKSIRVYGLCDDPPTARILLCCQLYFAKKDQLPPLTEHHLSVLRELNWLARRTAVQASYITKTGHYFNLNLTSVGESSKVKSKSVKKKGQPANQHGGVTDIERKIANLSLTEDAVIDKSNILARLRFVGHEDLVILCISWI